MFLARAPIRWDLWLGSIGLLIVVALTCLALLTDRALRERHELVVAGHLLELAHEIELDLRENGVQRSPSILERHLASHRDLVRGITLTDLQHRIEAEVGGHGGPGVERIEVFLGHAARARPTIPGAASARAATVVDEIHLLSMWAADQADRRPLWETLLPVASLGAGLAIFGLALVGGRRLERQRVLADQTARRRRLETLAQAGAGLAHQLRTPVATIKGTSQMLLDRSSGKEARRLERILEQSESIERLVRQLLDFSKPIQAEPIEIDIHAALQDSAALDPRVRVAEDLGGTVWCDPDHLTQILANLTANALQMSQPEGMVEIGTETVAGNPGRLSIWVSDQGPGPGDDPEHLFQPYVTTRTDGTGLGLPIARALADANGGTLTLEALPGGGTVARLILPITESGG